MRDLPPDFPIPLIVIHHLGPGSNTVEMYDNLLPFAAVWVRDGSALTPGTVLICPALSWPKIPSVP